MLCFPISILWVAFLATCARAIFPPSGAYSVDRNLARQLSQPSEYNDLGSSLSSSPNCLTRDGHEAHCFFVTNDRSVGYVSVIDGRATFDDFGGTVVDQPQVVGYGRDGVFALFVTPKQKLAVAAVKTGTDFDKTVTVLDLGTFLEAPGCVTLEGDDEVFCVIRATNGGMHTFRFEDGRWGNYAYITDNPTGPVSCVLNTVAGKIHCWATTEYGDLGERLFADTGLPDSPFWVSRGLQGRGRVSVYMLGVIPLPRALSYYGQKMIDIFGSFGGSLTSEPDCANADSRSLDCFALDEDHGLQRNYQLMGFLYVRRTSGWVHYGGDFVGRPSCIFMTGDDQFHCFMRSSAKDTLVEGVFKSLHSPRSFATT